MADLIACETCGKEIAADADRCPHCGKSRFPIYFAAILAAIILLGLIL